MKKIILAFSGGLDTSFCIPYLAEQGYQVITVTVNTGGFTPAQLAAIKKTAKTFGSVKHYEIDAQATLYKKFAAYIIKANYLKGGVYPACVGPERTVIAESLIDIAKKEKTMVIAHGSTGAGNDQVRFDVALRALLPGVNIIAPIRDAGLTRAQEISYLTQKNFTVNKVSKDYSINIGLLGTTIGGKETKGTQNEIPEEIFPTVASLKKVNGKPEVITLRFDKGLPSHLNGKSLTGVQIITDLNHLGAAHGFGKDYHIGTTIIGLKGRIAFEAPGVKILIKAHQELEKIVLTSKQLFWKNMLGTLYGDLIHDGLYYEPLARDLEALFDRASAFVTGEVTLRLHLGTIAVVSLSSQHSLLDKAMGTYGEEATGWSGADAKGFCSIYGLESINAFRKQHE